MSIWIILIIVLVWLALPAFLILAACMNSSRLSRAEEAIQSDSTRRFVRQDKRTVAQQHAWEIPRESEPVRLPVRYGEG
jgi:flagellar basal body-associated protein FliL